MSGSVSWVAEVKSDYPVLRVNHVANQFDG